MISKENSTLLCISLIMKDRIDLVPKFFRLPPNQQAIYPNWILIYFFKIIIPMLGMVAAASKIIIKNGKDLHREFF